MRTCIKGVIHLIHGSHVNFPLFHRLYFDTGVLFKGMGTLSQFARFVVLEVGLISSTLAVYPFFLVGFITSHML